MDNKRLKIAFLSRYSPDDRSASSGTNFKMAEQLRLIGDLDWIQIKESTIGHYGARLSRLWNRLFKKHINFYTSLWGSKFGYKHFCHDQFKDYDIIAAFFCMPVLANLVTDKPIVYFSDATAPAMLDYYPGFSNLYQFNQKQLIELERKAMDNSDAIVLSSAWAANSAIISLSQSERKVHIIEFGANIDEIDINNNERSIGDRLNILFLGVDWVRKGGDIAVEAVKWLNENDIPATLHIIGIKDLPTKYQDEGYIKNYGFLNKNIPEEYQKLNQVISQMHCMLLPTIAECAGIAFAEASANGLPVFTHNTGGVANYIHNGYNGYMLPIGSTGSDFGQRIKDVVERNELNKLSEGGRKIYQERLNWNIWGNKVAEIINSLNIKNNYYQN